MNYQHLAILCSFILVYSLFTKRIEKISVSGPILYVLFGFLVGPLVLNLFDIEIDDEGETVTDWWGETLAEHGVNPLGWLLD